MSEASDLPTELYGVIIDNADRCQLCPFSLVSREWYRCCLKRVIRLITQKETKRAFLEGDHFSIVRSLQVIRRYYVSTWAYRCGDSQLIKLVREHYAFEPPELMLHGACRGGHMDHVRVVGSMADLNKINDGFVGACRGGHLLIAKFMLAKGAKSLGHGYQAAVRGGHQELINELFVNPTSYTHQLLLGSARCGHLAGLKTGLALGYDLPRSAFYAVCRSGSIDCIDELIKRGVKACQVGLISACRSGNLEAVNKIASLIDVVNWNEVMLLACNRGDEAVVKLASERGADNFNVGFRIACENGHFKIARDIPADKLNWNYGLREAARFGDIEFVQLMLEREPNLDLNEALSLACNWKHPEIVKLLILKGATYCTYCYRHLNEH